MSKLKSVVQTLLVLIFLPFSLPLLAAHHDLEERINALEAKLAESDVMIEMLSNEVQALNGNLQDGKLATGKPLKKTSQSLLSRFVNGPEGLSQYRERVDLGAYLHGSFTHVNGQHKDTSAFNRQRFGLYVRAEVNDQISAFAAGDFARDAQDPFGAPNGTIREEPYFDELLNRVELQVAWVNYYFNKMFNLKFGRFLNPHLGDFYDRQTAKPLYEKMAYKLLDPERPLYVQPFNNSTIFPTFIQGVQAHGGKTLSKDLELGYNVYAATYDTNADDILYGGRIVLDYSPWNSSLAINYFYGDRDKRANDHFDGYGLDYEFSKGRFALNAQVLKTNETDDDRGLAGGRNIEDKYTWFVQPSWQFKPYLIGFYKYDFIDDGLRGGDVQEHALGVNFMPWNTFIIRYIVRKRLHHASRQTDTPGADSWVQQLSTSIYF